jgi:hypothetical protein
MQKFAMPFHLFWPPLFCLISPEAYLSGKALLLTYNNTTKKAGKGQTENRAGSMACSAEGFFCLDFFGPFCIKAKRTSLRGN